MQEAELEVDDLEWDDANEDHCARHGVTPTLVETIVETIKDDAPKFYANREGRTGTHMMIGSDELDRLWTIIILPAGAPGRRKAITGWPSTNTEIGLYQGA